MLSENLLFNDLINFTYLPHSSLRHSPVINGGHFESYTTHERRRGREIWKFTDDDEAKHEQEHDVRRLDLLWLVHLAFIYNL